MKVSRFSDQEKNLTLELSYDEYGILAMVMAAAANKSSLLELESEGLRFEELDKVAGDICSALGHAISAQADSRKQ